LQLWPVPQIVPFGTAVKVSLQAVGVVQASTPTWQGFAGVQAAAGVQVAQAPPIHTWPVPQVVPSKTVPLSVHTGAPELQTMAAVWHGLVDVQVVPAAQATQAPLGEQTRPAPQVVPAGWKVRSVQTGKPELHS
jgi:hypothetical protein